MRRTWRIFFFSLCLLAGRALADKAEIQWDPDYDFSSIRTFAWDESQVTLRNANPFLHQSIVDAIEAEFTQRGWIQDQSNPDVRVTYFASADREVRLQPSATSYYSGNYGVPGWNHSGYGHGGPLYGDTRIVEFASGTLVVDIWDTSNNELIWRGSVADIDVSQDSVRTARRAEKVIKKLARHAERLRQRTGS